MKTAVLVGLALVAVGLTAAAGPFLGVEVVPTGDLGVPYLITGWDGGWILTTVGFSDPFRATSWYMLNVSPMWNITPSWRIGGGLATWIKLSEWQIADLRWSTSVAVVGKIRGILGFIRFHIPMHGVPEDAPLFGVWLSMGFAYDFTSPYHEPGPGGARW